MVIKYGPHHTVTAKVKRPFQVELRAAGAAGYEWKPVFDPEDFRLLDHKKVADLRRMGRAGKDVFRFSPLSKGSFEIRFKLKRPWEDTAAEEEHFRLQVD